MGLLELVQYVSGFGLLQRKPYGSREYTAHIRFGWSRFACQTAIVVSIFLASYLLMFSNSGMSCNVNGELLPDFVNRHCAHTAYHYVGRHSGFVTKPNVFNAVLEKNEFFYNNYGEEDRTDNFIYKAPLSLICYAAIVALAQMIWTSIEAGHTSELAGMIRALNVFDETRKLKEKEIFSKVLRNIRKEGNTFKTGFYFGSLLLEIITLWLPVHVIFVEYGISPGDLFYRRTTFTWGYIDPMARTDILGKIFPHTIKCLVSHYGPSGTQQVTEFMCDSSINFILQSYIVLYGLILMFALFLSVLSFIVCIVLFTIKHKTVYSNLKIDSALMFLLLKQNLSHSDFEDLTLQLKNDPLHMC